MVMLAKHCIFVIEQPVNSLMEMHPRMDWFINHVCWAAGFNRKGSSCVQAMEITTNLGFQDKILDDAPWWRLSKTFCSLQQCRSGWWIRLWCASNERPEEEHQSDHNENLRLYHITAHIYFPVLQSHAYTPAMHLGRYKDKTGKQRFVGTSQLRGTATLG